MDELRAVLGDRVPVAADLRDLNYPEMIASESLQLHPPAYALAEPPLSPLSRGACLTARSRQGEIVPRLRGRVRSRHHPRVVPSERTSSRRYRSW